MTVLVLSRTMADYATLFQLILAALTFVIIGMGFIVYIMILDERERKKLKTERISAATKVTPGNCPHYFGYLRQYPSEQPIPDECFGCMKAIQCINKQLPHETAENPSEIPETVQQD